MHAVHVLVRLPARGQHRVVQARAGGAQRASGRPTSRSACCAAARRGSSTSSERRTGTYDRRTIDECRRHDPGERRRPRRRTARRVRGPPGREVPRTRHRSSSRRADGTMAWLYEGQELVNVALNAVAGRPRDEYGFEPSVDRRDPSRLLRRPRSGEGHGRRRRARARCALRRSPATWAGSSCEAARPRPGRGDGPGLQRLAHRRVGGSYPGRFIPLACR